MPGSKFACYRIAGVRHALSVNSLNSQGVLRDMTSMRQNLDSHLTEATAALELVLEEGREARTPLRARPRAWTYPSA